MSDTDNRPHFCEQTFCRERMSVCVGCGALLCVVCEKPKMCEACERPSCDDCQKPSNGGPEVRDERGIPTCAGCSELR